MDKNLLKIICCPACKSDLELKEKELLICKNQECHKEYIIKDNIPVLLTKKI